MSVVVSSLAFGFAHYQGGPVGILGTAAFGLLFAWIYLRSGRNLWVTMFRVQDHPAYSFDISGW